MAVACRSLYLCEGLPTLVISEAAPSQCRRMSGAQYGFDWPDAMGEDTYRQVWGSIEGSYMHFS